MQFDPSGYIPPNNAKVKRWQYRIFKLIGLLKVKIKITGLGESNLVSLTKLISNQREEVPSQFGSDERLRKNLLFCLMLQAGSDIWKGSLFSRL